jgi:hypothetical protein
MGCLRLLTARTMTAKQLRVMNSSKSLLLLITALATGIVGNSDPARNQSIYLVAVRDSRLLTMCPEQPNASLPGGKYHRPDGNAAVYSRSGLQTVTFFDESHATVILPLPAAGSLPGDAAPKIGEASIELDRLATDTTLKTQVEREFRKQKLYQLVDSADKADLVFLVEGLYVPMGIASSGGNKVIMAPGGDQQANFLQAVFAIAVASKVYESASGVADLIDARLWEGSVVMWSGRELANPRSVYEIRSASPEELVKQLCNKATRPASHFPLCGASSRTSPLERSRPSNPNVKPELRDTVEKTQTESKFFRPSDDPMIKVDVTLVTVPVVVSDSEGRRVSNLEPLRFQLFEDGVEQKIDRSYARKRRLMRLSWWIPPPACTLERMRFTRLSLHSLMPAARKTA